MDGEGKVYKIFLIIKQLFEKSYTDSIEKEDNKKSEEEKKEEKKDDK